MSKNKARTTEASPLNGHKRAVIYARVSTDDQRGNFSIPSQLDASLQYAGERGYAIVGDQYVDAETGQDVAAPNDGAVRAYVDDFTSRELSRPSLDALLAYLETTGADIVVVHALDRLARDPYIRQTLEREIEKYDAKVEYVLGNYGESPEGEVRKDLDATFAKWENVKRTERCNRGKRRKAESGLFVAGRAPFGYSIDKNALGGLAVVREQANVVSRIFTLYVEDGQSIRAIADKLTREQVTPLLKGDRWRKSSVVKILRNPIYAGRGFYNKHKRVDRKRLTVRDKSDWVSFRTTPIVEQWLFDAAQERLEHNRATLRRSPQRFYLLSGMVECGVCERPYVAQTAKAGRNRRITDAQTYRHRTKEGHCRNHMVSARKLEPVVWSEVEALLRDPKKLLEGYKDSLEQQAAAGERKRAYLKTLNHQAQRLEQRRDNLLTAYTDPEIRMTKKDYLKQKAAIDTELAEVAQKVEKTESELADIKTPADLETFRAFASAIRDELDNGEELTPQEKRKFFEMLHLKAVIKSDGGIDIKGWFSRDCLSSKTSVHCVLRPRRLRARA